MICIFFLRPSIPHRPGAPDEGRNAEPRPRHGRDGLAGPGGDNLLRQRTRYAFFLVFFSRTVNETSCASFVPVHLSWSKARKKCVNLHSFRSRRYSLPDNRAGPSSRCKDAPRPVPSSVFSVCWSSSPAPANRIRSRTSSPPEQGEYKKCRLF